MWVCECAFYSSDPKRSYRIDLHQKWRVSIMIHHETSSSYHISWVAFGQIWQVLGRNCAQHFRELYAAGCGCLRNAVKNGWMIVVWLVGNFETTSYCPHCRSRVGERNWWKKQRFPEVSNIFSPVSKTVWIGCRSQPGSRRGEKPDEVNVHNAHECDQIQLYYWRFQSERHFCIGSRHFLCTYSTHNQGAKSAKTPKTPVSCQRVSGIHLVSAHLVSNYLSLRNSFRPWSRWRFQPEMHLSVQGWFRQGFFLWPLWCPPDPPCPLHCIASGRWDAAGIDGWHDIKTKWLMNMAWPVLPIFYGFFGS